ncbi:MAG: TIGR04283 family arsenosugar biosynthesis glycosyltransferase [Rhodobacteraceae bacterium]|nr:TIGR04283 family arsenosugar biosynthesis glycosyltransferase [Paracoccaceae bacterium]
MRAPLSIVIPTLNATATLPDVLAALFEGLEAGLVREVIISDGGSTDDIEALAEEVGARFLSGPAGRGGQLRRGVAVARGGWVLALHADTVLAPGWAAAVLGHLGQYPGRAACFRLAFRAEGLAPRLVAFWANIRTRIFALPYGDQGLLVPRALYDRAGGYPDIPLMEDVALVRRLDGRVMLLPVRAITGADRYLARGWLKQGAGNLWRLLHYLGGADPARLAGRY